MAWMSHGDQVTRPPKGFIQLGYSKNCANVAIADEKRKIYGLQFHPEVVHTKNGMKILKSFVKLTKAKKDWSMSDFVKKEVAKQGDRHAFGTIQAQGIHAFTEIVLKIPHIRHILAWSNLE